MSLQNLNFTINFKILKTFTFVDDQVTLKEKHL